MHGSLVTNRRGKGQQGHMMMRSAWVRLASILPIIALLAATPPGCHSVLASQDEEPIEIVSLLGPIGPANPGGTAIEITVRNVGTQPVVSLAVTLEIATTIVFTFEAVAPSDPLQPGGQASAVYRLMRGGFNNRDTYPLTINTTLEDGTGFIYAKLVQVAQPLAEPPLVPFWGWAAIGVGIAVLAIAFALIQRRRRAK
jgi:hypothetical protein